MHFAGKVRDIADVKIFLKQAKAANIQNLLLLTGDKLKQHQDGRRRIATYSIFRIFQCGDGSETTP